MTLIFRQTKMTVVCLNETMAYKMTHID